MMHLKSKTAHLRNIIGHQGYQSNGHTTSVLAMNACFPFGDDSMILNRLNR